LKRSKLFGADVPLDTLANHAAQLGGRQRVKLNAITFESQSMRVAGALRRP
jgi:hypothetical protein